MKKVTYNHYGDADVLQVTEAEIPAISEKGILVKTKAVSINPLDWKIFKGELKMMSGSRFPKGVGIDFAGVIENTGNQITGFRKGDEVFGLSDVFKGSALAEYIVVTEKDIAIKPKKITFEQAAASPVAGLSALQILNEIGSVKSGTSMLINGATGGIGMFLIQLAKKQGAIITAVTSSKGAVMAKQWGANEIIDYKAQSVLALRQRFDVVVDLSGKLSFKDSRPLLNPGAIFVTTIPSLKTIAGSFFNNLFSRTKYKVLTLKPSTGSLNQLATLMESGIDIVIAIVYKMTAAKSAYAEVARGGLVGKAVMTV